MPAFAIRCAFWLTPLLLVLSNIFMTIAWYWHLKFKTVPLWKVILISWGVAFLEYCLAVPANRWGSGVYSAPQLKALQELITLGVFAVFSIVYLDQSLRWNHAVGFGFLVAAAWFLFEA